MARAELGSMKNPISKTSGSRRHSARRRPEGLAVEPVFCPTDIADPFDTVEWDQRTAAIKDESGGVLFEQTNCEIPKSWSQLATNVVVSKYFYGEINTPQRENSVRQIIHRVSRTIADWGLQDGYFASAEDGENFYRDLTWLCLHQHGAFNSPVWFNVGLYHQYGVKGAQCNWHWDPVAETVNQPENPYEYPQGSACFIQSVRDDMEDIMELARSEAMLFKFGSGTGTDLSTLRSHREKLSGGGRPSGPLSFMRVYDQIAAVVKSGGKTRRAAKMQSLKVGHPDIMEFIECKAKEEKKALVLIEKGGYEANFNGEAYSSIMFQNANLSVRVTDEFMQAVTEDKPWVTHWVTNPNEAGPSWPAREMLGRMSECAWSCGDPGVQYDSTINHWNTCPNSGRINASNPCSEYMFLDDTACNLASINLMKFRNEDGSFDVDRFHHACRIYFIAQEILVDHASYPTKRIAENSHRFRPLGLGYSNLGSLIMASGLPYDSDAARGLCGAITALLHGAANLTSSELAAAVGPFDSFEINRDPMLHVMQMHRDAVERIDEACPGDLKEAARSLWDEVLDAGRASGFRNAQATVLAPTGTISFMMDCDTTGIEPDIALVKYKQLAGGGMLKIVNQTVPLGLKTLGYDEPQIESILAYIDKHDTIEGAPELQPEHLPVFDCAFQPRNGTRSIGWRAHVLTMAAAQPFLSGAISKTVNMPRDTTPADIASAYLEGWRLGLKALAIYRDGSKESQPLSTSSEGDKAAAKQAAVPRREHLQDTRNSITHKFSVSGHEGYITVGLYEDGRPGELFITMAKEGSTIGGLMDCFGTAVSMSWQYGVPLEVYVNKFSHTRFEPMGHTKNPDIRIAKSIVDYIFRWLGITFLPGFREAQQGLLGDEGPTVIPKSDDAPIEDQRGLLGDEQRAGVVTPRTSSKPVGQARGLTKAPAAKHSTGPTIQRSAPTSSPSPLAGEGRGEGATAQKRPEKKARSTSQPPAPSPQSPSRPDAALLERAGVAMKVDLNGGHFSTQSEQFAKFQLDAPSCDNCGSITVRSGNCYLCYNCGNSMGCS
ncbi:MAG TPA: vitamin B12-dependent ribonucleotide reductase [Pirellulales bacterium]|nr:vitamin B12-dependent ribonucleotide reductase [Pirellulales bacterium]